MMNKLLLAAALLMSTQVALAAPGNGQGNAFGRDRNDDRGRDRGHHTAPIPVIGAGLPAVALLGIAAGVVYGLRRRRQGRD